MEKSLTNLIDGIPIDNWKFEIIDPLPYEVYVIEIGFIEKIEYSTGKSWINRHPVVGRIFTDLNKALDGVKEFKNKIVGKRYMLMYLFLEDGTKDYIFRSYGSLAYKDSRY